MNATLQIIVDILYIFYLLLKELVLLLVPNKLRYKNLKGETVLITGGGSGIGRLLALRFAGLGSRVIVWDINKKGNEETVDLIKSDGGECYSYICDVTDKNNVYSTAQKVKDELGSVTILINNAGIVTGKKLLDISDHMIEKTFQVNTISHFWTCKAFLPDMMAANHGHIVSVASLAGLNGSVGLVDYCASKHAAVGFHESLFLELDKENYTGIKTTLICPYFINTGMFTGIEPAYIPLLEPDYVADSIVSAIRINQILLILPWYFNILQFLKSVLPSSTATVCHQLFKSYDYMNNFRGRNVKTD